MNSQVAAIRMAAPGYPPSQNPVNSSPPATAAKVTAAEDLGPRRTRGDRAEAVAAAGMARRPELGLPGHAATSTTRTRAPSPPIIASRYSALRSAEHTSE